MHIINFFILLSSGQPGGRNSISCTSAIPARYPKFDEKDEKYLRISALSKTAHGTVSTFLKTIHKTKKIEGLQLGKIRLDIKAHLSKEMKEIDKLVKQIIG